MPPPREPEQEQRVHRPPWWMAPPPDRLPGVIADPLLVARGQQLAVALAPVSVYPNGLELSLRIFFADEFVMDHETFHQEAGGFVGPARAEVRERLLRFGVQYPDGTKVTNLDDPQARLGRDPADMNKPPERPVMLPHGAGGGPSHWQLGFWLHPLPDDGELMIVVEWPHRGVPETSAQLEAGRLRDAAEQGRRVWDD